MLRKNITEFCKFLIEGCIVPYRKWILSYTGMEEKKYEKWIFSIILNELWAVADGAMGKTLFQIISKAKVPLKIDHEALTLARMHILPE